MDVCSSEQTPQWVQWRPSNSPPGGCWGRGTGHPSSFRHSLPPRRGPRSWTRWRRGTPGWCLSPSTRWCAQSGPVKIWEGYSLQAGFKSILLIVHFCRWQSINYLYIFLVFRPVPQVDEMKDILVLLEDQVFLSHRRQPCHGGDWQWPGQGPGGCLLLPDDFIWSKINCLNWAVAVVISIPLGRHDVRWWCWWRWWWRCWWWRAPSWSWWWRWWRCWSVWLD